MRTQGLLWRSSSLKIIPFTKVIESLTREQQPSLISPGWKLSFQRHGLAGSTAEVRDQDSLLRDTGAFLADLQLHQGSSLPGLWLCHQQYWQGPLS